MAKLSLHDVRKSFGALEIIHGINLEIPSGSFTVFVGPSGCGKSTLLRMISGLESLTDGEIRIADERCDHLVPSARGMAMVFQSYALYPHMTVRNNLRFGLENQKYPKKQIEERVGQAAKILQIEDLLDRKPSQLSGGQSQRVAIGRAIVKEPKAFLFDEPLSNLDAELRVKMRGEIIDLHRQLASTMIYVTHDQVEAMTMADQIVVLNAGQVQQVGHPLELYARPKNMFVAGFLGSPSMNFLKGKLVQADGAWSVSVGKQQITLRVGELSQAATHGQSATLGIRPEHLSIDPTSSLKVKIETVESLGSETVAHCRTEESDTVVLTLRGISSAKVGDIIGLSFEPAFAHLFAEDDTALSGISDWRADYAVEVPGIR